MSRNERAAEPPTSPSLLVRYDPSRIHLQRRQERRLRNLHFTELAHPLLAFFLLLQQLPLPRDIAAVALRRHILRQRADRFARDHPAADRRLDRYLEQLPRDQVFQPATDGPTAALRHRA